MHIAKSMYMGGIVIYADDDFLNDSSYFELGLLCLGCDNDIYPRRGQVNRRHFAHRKAISEEEKRCAYRVNEFVKNFGGNFSGSARNQRRDIFQAYLTQFIASSHKDFYRKINSQVELGDLNLYIEACASYYYKVKYDFIAQCRQIKNMNLPTHEIANNLVSGEVFSYLGCESSKTVLKKICLYSALKIKDEMTDESVVHEDISVERVVDRLRAVILNTCWNMLYKPMSISWISRELEYRLRKSLPSDLEEKGLINKSHGEKAIRHSPSKEKHEKAQQKAQKKQKQEKEKRASPSDKETNRIIKKAIPELYKRRGIGEIEERTRDYEREL